MTTHTPTHPQPGGIVPDDKEIQETASSHAPTIYGRTGFILGCEWMRDRLAPHIAAMENRIKELERDVENWKSVAHRNATNNK